MALKVAVIGHMTPLPNAIAIPANQRDAANMLRLYNFTRVATPEGELVDHVTYVRALRGAAATEAWSVWEMYLCAPLLLASHLRRHGHETLLVNRIDSESETAEFARLSAFAPDIVVLSTTFVLSKRHLTDIGRRVRQHCPGAFVVAGGYHVYTTLLYMGPDEQAEYLAASGCDAFVNDAQGETTLITLCDHFPDALEVVPNLVWRRPDGGAGHNPRCPETNRVDDTLIDFDGLGAAPVVHLRTARSCSFKCAFCSYPTVAGPLAQMDHDNVMLTVRKARDAGVKAVFFVDDTFNVPRPRFEALLDAMIAEGIEIPWYSFLRCQHVDQDLVRKMRRSGCAGVFLGIESGSDEILKKMKKGAVVNFYRDGIRWLREESIVTVGSFLLGFPGETHETVEETRRFIDESGLDYYFIQPFYYLHHTPIHKRAAEFGLSGNGLFWSHDTMNWRQAVDHINRLFLQVEGATFINPDYTLWEVAYLRTKGMSFEEIRDYRQTINAMTRAQMERFGLTAAPVA